MKVTEKIDIFRLNGGLFKKSNPCFETGPWSENIHATAFGILSDFNITANGHS